MTYQKTLDWLFAQLPMFHRLGKAAYKANLDNTYTLDEYFGHPHKKFRTIHVAGTNGKGSTSHYLASIFQHAGYKTGLYTSPHLIDFRERIKIDGKMISENFVCEFVEKHKTFFEKLQPSFFEMTVALAFDYFASENIDVAVVEVGLGGRLDSTNIISPEVSVITNISFDHTDLLGETLPEIAGEKAGIIKPQIPVVIGETHNETEQVFIEKAKSLNAPIIFADQHFECRFTKRENTNQFFDIFKNKELLYENVITDLAGIYQKKNLATVFQTIEILKQKDFILADEHILNGIATASQTTGLMGRWQTIRQKPLTICDTGHNIDGIKQVLQQISLTPHKTLHFIFGMVNDKDTNGVLELLPTDAKYYFTKASIPRALDENLLAEKASKYNLFGHTFPDVKCAFEDATKNANDDDLIFIGGSTFVVADLLQLTINN